MKFIQSFTIAVTLFITVSVGAVLEDFFVVGSFVDSNQNILTDIQVIISVNDDSSGANLVLDTMYTNYQGTVSGKISTSLTLTEILYQVSKNGYQSVSGSCSLDQWEPVFNLGIITLIEIPSPIINTITPIPNQAKPNSIRLFNLKGQLLYDGRMCDIRKLAQNKIANSQMFIVHYMLDNKVLSREKMTLSR